MASLGELLGQYLLGLPPEAEVVEGTRGAMLPGAKYRLPDGSERWSLAAPQPMADALMAVGAAGGRAQDPNAPQGYVSQGLIQRGAEGLAGSATLGSVVAPKPANAVAMGLNLWHGSPYKHNRFDKSKIGTGEGAQAFGHGHYLAEAKGVAKSYKDALGGKVFGPNPTGGPRYVVDGALYDNSNPTHYAASKIKALGSPDEAIKDIEYRYWSEFESPEARTGSPNFSAEKAAARAKADEAIALIKSGNVPEMKTPGYLYNVDVDAEPNQFLDWDKPLSEQPEIARALGFDDPSAIEARRSDIMSQIPPSQKPLSDMSLDDLFGTPQQQQELGAALRDAGTGLRDWTGLTGQSLVKGGHLKGTPEEIANQLLAAGLKGVRYLDQSSRSYNPSVLPENPISNEARRFLNQADGDPDKARQLFKESNPGERWATSEREEIYKVFQEAGNKPTRNYVVMDDDIITIKDILAANRSQSAAPGQILAQKNALDPSPAARMARAREMGWDTDTPHYRGMTRVYDPDKAPDWQFFSTNPEEASGYAPGLVGDKIKPNVMASYLRPGRQLVVEGGGANFNEIPVSGLPADVREIIARTTAREGVRTDDIAKAAKELGYDTVSFQNIYDRSWGEKPPKNTGMDWDEIQNLLTELTGEAPAPKPKNWEATQARRNEPGTVTAVINPANIRARTAMFDPARINETDPLAANPLAGALITPGAGAQRQSGTTISDILPGEKLLTPEEVADLEFSRNPQRAKRNRLQERARNAALARALAGGI